MKLPLQITFRDMVPLPSLEPEIRRRVAKLDHWTNEVMSCHVVVEAEGSRHRQGHEYRVKVSVRVPDDEIVAGAHQGSEDVYVALHGAFDAMDRQLEDHVRRRRGQTKEHPVVRHGRIVALDEEGVGRIVGDAGDEYRFDRGMVEHPPFEHLTIDQEVRFIEAIGRTGREARRVCGA
jgi:ribosomal subunit interface protein